MRNKMKLWMFLVFSFLIFTACTKDPDKVVVEPSTNKEGDVPTPIEPAVKSEVIEKKDFTLAYNAEVSTLNYLTSSLSTVNQLTTNYIDALVNFDKYGVMIPCLAKEYTVSPDGLVYTFTLREGVNWYTHTGDVYAEVVADDFVAAAEYVMNPENASTAANVLYDMVENGAAYFAGEVTDFSEVGIKALDTYTLEYTLVQPAPYFARMTSYVVFLPVNRAFLAEQGEKFGTSNDSLLYNGAYIFEDYMPESRRYLALNEDYWDVDSIHISSITYLYNKEAKTLAPELFLRGEIDEATIPNEILDEWMTDPEKSQLVNQMEFTTFSYYMGFNFEPLYEAEYNPENWEKAVNNINFRKSLFHALDKVSILNVRDPYNPESSLLNTITLPDWIFYDGVDYVDFDAIKTIKETTTYDENKALKYKEEALMDLEGEVTFPIKVVMPYNSGALENTKMVQVIEQQMEKTLGIDYIDIELVSYPPTGFNKEARSSGKFSMMVVNWGPDFVDPASLTDVMVSSTSIGPKYSRPYMATDAKDAEGNSIYETMIEEAKKETLDVKKRYEMFAEAEAFLIDNALVLPFYRSGGSYSATKLDPYSGYCTQNGRSMNKLKGKTMLDKPLTPAELEAVAETYLKEQKEAVSNATFEIK